jgi:hypothetical protein
MRVQVELEEIINEGLERGEFDTVEEDNENRDNDRSDTGNNF